MPSLLCTTASNNKSIFCDSSEVINDWITILRNQLHELKVLESKSNLYSKAPRLPMQFGLQRDPNSPLPAPPQPPVLNATLLGSAGQ